MVTILERIKKGAQSIRWRLVLTYFIIIALTLVLISVYITNSMQQYSLNQKRIQTLSQANIIAGYISNYQDLSSESINYLLEQQQVPSDCRVLMLDNDARVTYDSNNGTLQGKYMPVPVVLDALNGNNGFEKAEDADGEMTVAVAVPIIQNKTVTGVIYYRTAASEIDALMNQIWGNLTMLAVLISILIGIISFAMSGLITAPIIDLTKKLSRAADENTELVIEKKTGGEIGELLESFGKMTKQIQLQEEKRQEFVSNASHELKTPLSSIKLISDSLLNVEDAPREMIVEFLTDMNVQVERLTRIIDKLLTLTRMDNPGSVTRMEFAVTDLSELCQNITKALRPLAEQKHIELIYSAEAAIYSKIERDRIWEAIYNIIDNSIKYTKEEGSVTVTLEKEEGNAIVTVKDTGIGIASDEIYKIFDRFYRVDKARTRETGGTGLGLSIALTAIELHGGNIQVESEEGVGSTFRIIIPITFK
ncbi:MAG: HAMP domain-containing sensor histidine kinase [Clostridia bacterium]|nr:HAMP domain-containing sensor histidine kinase [Clostridia bacterium]